MEPSPRPPVEAGYRVAPRSARPRQLAAALREVLLQQLEGHGQRPEPTRAYLPPGPREERPQPRMIVVREHGPPREITPAPPGAPTHPAPALPAAPPCGPACR